jgi:hypothetical protein
MLLLYKQQVTLISANIEKKPLAHIAVILYRVVSYDLLFKQTMLALF